MLTLQVRKIVIQLEETMQEMGREVIPPSRKVTVAAVITNPYAGQYVQDLSPLYALGAEIGACWPNAASPLSALRLTMCRATARALSLARRANSSMPQR